MADTKISALTTKTPPISADLVPIVDSVAGDNKKVTVGSLATPLGVSGTNSGDETAARIAAIDHATSAKNPPVDADEIPINDSAATPAYSRAKVLWSVIKSTLKTYFDGLYPSGSGTSSGTNTGDETLARVSALVQAASAKTAPVDADSITLVDSEATPIGTLKKMTWAYVKSVLKTYFDGLYTLANLGGEAVANKSTDVTLGGGTPSSTLYPTQAAVKSYADQLIAAQDAMVFKGVISCSGNPNYPAADRGHTYRVSVAGKIGGASGVNVEVGDLLICLTDGTVAGDQATVGTAWTIIQGNIDGAVIGPASVTDGQAVLFDQTTGKLIKASALTGIIKQTSGVPSVATAGTDYQPPASPQGTTSSATPTLDFGTTGAEIRYDLTAQAANMVFQAPTGTPVNGQRFFITIVSDATPRTIDLTTCTSFTAVGSVLPTTTVASKITQIAGRYNSTRGKYLIDYVNQE